MLREALVVVLGADFKIETLVEGGPSTPTPATRPAPVDQQAAALRHEAFQHVPGAQRRHVVENDDPMAVEIGAGHRFTLAHVHLKCRRGADRQCLLQKQARLAGRARRFDDEDGKPLRR